MSLLESLLTFSYSWNAVTGSSGKYVCFASVLFVMYFEIVKNVECHSLSYKTLVLTQYIGTIDNYRYRLKNRNSDSNPLIPIVEKTYETMNTKDQKSN